MITGMPRIAIAVRDFEETIVTFRDKFNMPVMDISESSVPALGAKLAMCVPEGGSNIEIMSPANPAAPLSQSLLRFMDRRGEGLFALMLEAPDPDAEAEDLLGRGLNVLPLMEGAGGRDVHPNSTNGVLIRVYPVNSFEGQDPNASESSDSPKISGIMRVIIAVRDLDQAKSIYGSKFQMGITASSMNAEKGIQSAICKPPSGGMIELVSPVDTDQPFARSIAAFLDTNGEGMYALVLQSGDLHASARSLVARGLKVTPSSDSVDILEVERSCTFGALVRIEPS